jgi:hypothetical protein
VGKQRIRQTVPDLGHRELTHNSKRDCQCAKSNSKTIVLADNETVFRHLHNVADLIINEQQTKANRNHESNQIKFLLQLTHRLCTAGQTELDRAFRQLNQIV